MISPSTEQPVDFLLLDIISQSSVGSQLRMLGLRQQYRIHRYDELLCTFLALGLYFCQSHARCTLVKTYSYMREICGLQAPHPPGMVWSLVGCGLQAPPFSPGMGDHTIPGEGVGGPATYRFPWGGHGEELQGNLRNSKEIDGIPKGIHGIPKEI